MCCSMCKDRLKNFGCSRRGMINKAPCPIIETKLLLLYLGRGTLGITEYRACLYGA